MRSWLIFASGVCAGALAVSAWFQWEKPAGSQRQSETVERLVETKIRDNRTAERTEAELASEALRRISQLHAWMERRVTMTPDEVRRAVSDWAKREPQLAADSILNAARFPNRLDALSVALAEWLTLDEASATAWLAQERLAEDRARLIRQVCEWLSDDYPRLVLRLAATLPPEELSSSLSTACGAIARTDPEEALRLAMSFEGWRRESAESAVWQTWVDTDVDGAIRWLKEHPEQISEASPRALLLACAKVQPAMCLELLQTHASLRNNYASQESVIALLESSPQHGEAALALFGKEQTTDVLKNWIWRGLEASPERAMSLLTQWIEPANRASVLRDGVRGWMISDEQAAKAWVETLVDPVLRKTAQAAVWEEIAERDPPRALQALVQLGVQSQDVAEGVGTALWKWSNHDPSAAARWVSAHADWVPGMVVRDVAGALLTKDDAEAAAWLAGLPAGAVRDHAIATAAHHWAEQGEMELVHQVVESIRDESQRTRTQYHIYNSLRLSDNSQAEAWLASLPLADAVKQQWRMLFEH